MIAAEHEPRNIKSGWIIGAAQKAAAESGTASALIRDWTEKGFVTTEQPFFVALVSAYSGWAAYGASVSDARTGQVTDLVKPPADAAFGKVTSCGGSEFILTVLRQAHSVLAYRLRVDAAGRAAEFAPLPAQLLPPECRGIAGSPGGRSLAYAAWDMKPPVRTAEAGLMDMVTGERRPASVPPGVVRYLSLANDGQTLAFQMESRSDAASGIYVVAATASDWVAQGRLLADLDGQPYDAISPVISAGGQAVYATVAQPGPWADPKWTRLLEVPVGGGQPRVLFELRYQEDRYNAAYMWGSACRDPAGESLLAFATGYAYRIEISSGAATMLPFPEGRPYDAAW